MKGTKVHVVICPVCKSGLFSVTRHDFHYCPCDNTFVDGGFDYTRFGTYVRERPVKTILLTVGQSQQELMDDYYNPQGRQYGTIDGDTLRFLYRKEFKKTLRLLATKSRSKKTTRGK